jgi:hypothetical protein
MVKGVNFNPNSFEFCESCMLVKHVRVKIYLKFHRAIKMVVNTLIIFMVYIPFVRSPKVLKRLKIV